MIDSAIADYDARAAARSDARRYLQCARRTLAQEGRPAAALADFAAAIKLNPDHPAAKANHKSLAQELERLGALMAVAGKPSFNCATARRAVEKAICADPELADLDREINAMNIMVVREAEVTARARRAPCSASRRSSSPAAMPRSAGRVTICARP